MVGVPAVIVVGLVIVAVGVTTVGAAANAAVTLLAASIVTRQVVLVPEQAPDQPVKVEPVAGVAVSLKPLPME